jgi:hypothetical protein
MTLETIRAIHSTQPFVPFTICLADGTKHRVTHPENLWVPPGEKGRTVVLQKGQDQFHMIDLLLVTELIQDRSVPRRRKSA